jgi:hypothetical protein
MHWGARWTLWELVSLLSVVVLVQTGCIAVLSTQGASGGRSDYHPGAIACESGGLYWPHGYCGRGYLTHYKCARCNGARSATKIA